MGFDKIIIRPQPVGDLKWVKASYDSVHGKVVSEWSREAGKFNLRVRVPVGATATVILPAKDGTPVTESGRPLEHASGVERLTREVAMPSWRLGPGITSLGLSPKARKTGESGLTRRIARPGNMASRTPTPTVILR